MASIYSILTLLYVLWPVSAGELPILTTKQNIKNIRFISSDGKFTYYQRGNGSLQFATNYKVSEVIKKEPKTHYNLILSNDKKYILVEVFEDYNRYFAARASAELYLIKYGTASIQEVGHGKALGLHQDDKWFSYYDSFEHKLILQSTLSSNLKHSIKLANIKNPYFIPQTVMPNSDTLYYTDINKSGAPGLLRYRLNASDVKLIHKEKDPNKNIEICLHQKLYLMSYGLDPLKRGSTIKSFDVESETFAKDPIYTTNENDIGSLHCNYKDQQKLFFVKTYRSTAGKLTYDAVEISLSKKNKVNRLSHTDFATSIFKMDEMLLLPYQNKFFILKGENILTEADQLLKNPALPKETE